MRNSLLRCQVVAVAAGILLAAVSFAFRSRTWQASFYHTPHTLWLHLAVESLPSIFAAYLVACWARRQDKVAFLTCAVPACVWFLIGYAGNLDLRAQMIEKGGFWDIVGYDDPFSLWDQGRVLATFSIPAIASGILGIALKRMTRPDSEGKGPPPSLAERRPFRRLLLWLSLGTACLLLLFFAQRLFTYSAWGKAVEAGWTFHSEKSTPTARRAALRDLAEYSSSTGNEVLLRVAKTQPPPWNLMADKILIRQGDLSWLPGWETALSSPDLRETAIREGIKPEAALMNMDASAAIPTLSRLARDDDRSVRLGAIRGLGGLHVPESREALCLALYDPDKEVRYHAIFGLIRNFHLLHTPQEKRTCPAWHVYQQDEDRYLGPWRDWAEMRWQTGSIGPVLEE